MHHVHGAITMLSNGWDHRDGKRAVDSFRSKRSLMPGVGAVGTIRLMRRTASRTP